MPRVVRIEIGANQPENVIAFYQGVFGWKITKWQVSQDYWLVSTGEAAEAGIDGGIFRPGELFSGTVNIVEVLDIDAYMEKEKAHGDQLVTEKTTIPGVGYLVYCKDVEGTIFGITQTDRSAGI